MSDGFHRELEERDLEAEAAMERPSDAAAGSPMYVPFHEAAVPSRENVELHSGLAVNLAEGRQVLAWKVKGDTGLAIRILRPLADGSTSVLKFGLTREAAVALHDLLCAQLWRENGASDTPAGGMDG